MNEVPAIGIDFGTSYCGVGVWHEGKLEILENEKGSTTTPSCVAFTETVVLVGDAALDQSADNPLNTIVDVKRLIGLRYEDARLTEYKKQWPFKVANENGKPMIEVVYKGQRKRYPPEQVSSLIINKMKEIAQLFLGSTIKRAVITAPAYFQNVQRQAIRDAGAIAGLDVIRVINEPVAAVIAYGFDKHVNGERNVLVYDLGGGTFDVSIININETLTFKVIAVAGDTHLGGEDFTTRLFHYLINQFKVQFGKDLCSNRALRKLRLAAEDAKRQFSTSNDATMEIESLTEDKNFRCIVTKSKFEELNSDLFDTTIKLVEKVLNDAEMNKTNIDEILLVGGSTKIPKIRELLQDFFDGKQINFSIDPEQAVAYGATIFASVLSNIHNPKIEQVLLVDIVPFSLGIKTAGGSVLKLIERNTKIPCRTTKTFTTCLDNQPIVRFQIYEGDSENAQDNILLGIFDLNGIPLASKGNATIKLTFNIDANGILTISARDQTSGNHRDITFKHRIDSDEIYRMKVDVYAFKEDERCEKERLMRQKSLEGYLEKLKQFTNDYTKDLSDSAKSKINLAYTNYLALLNGSFDPKTFEDKFKELKVYCTSVKDKDNDEPSSGHNDGVE